MTSKQMALGGISGALAIVILCLGGLIPFSTYILPMICCILLQMVLPGIGKRGGWVWYSAVCILSVLLCPDKEAAATMVFIGWYPLCKAKLDSLRLGLVLKLLAFNSAIFAMYFLLIFLFNFVSIYLEFQALGFWLTVLTLILGNVCFLLLDRALSIFSNYTKNRSVK